ncbi:hypothetical protein CARUB_v10010711mg [Capsella rubella]|uniref:Uncharacterized protein n=1 Tax=Capsella rubella TaxID=81985 RepID=R0IHK5_9BRAS|nr:hypothetical protein CARUB_v10010711mg [Capsella rubella]
MNTHFLINSKSIALKNNQRTVINSLASGTAPTTKSARLFQKITQVCKFFSTIISIIFFFLFFANVIIVIIQTRYAMGKDGSGCRGLQVVRSQSGCHFCHLLRYFVT